MAEIMFNRVLGCVKGVRRIRCTHRGCRAVVTGKHGASRVFTEFIAHSNGWGTCYSKWYCAEHLADARRRGRAAA